MEGPLPLPNTASQTSHRENIAIAHDTGDMATVGEANSAERRPVDIESLDFDNKSSLLRTPLAPRSHTLSESFLAQPDLREDRTIDVGGMVATPPQDPQRPPSRPLTLRARKRSVISGGKIYVLSNQQDQVRSVSGPTLAPVTSPGIQARLQRSSTRGGGSDSLHLSHKENAVTQKIGWQGRPDLPNSEDDERCVRQRLFKLQAPAGAKGKKQRHNIKPEVTRSPKVSIRDTESAASPETLPPRQSSTAVDCKTSTRNEQAGNTEPACVERRPFSSCLVAEQGPKPVSPKSNADMFGFSAGNLFYSGYSTTPMRNYGRGPARNKGHSSQLRRSVSSSSADLRVNPIASYLSKVDLGIKPGSAQPRDLASTAHVGTTSESTMQPDKSVDNGPVKSRSLSWPLTTISEARLPRTFRKGAAEMLVIPSRERESSDSGSTGQSIVRTKRLKYGPSYGNEFADTAAPKTITPQHMAESATEKVSLHAVTCFDSSTPRALGRGSSQPTKARNRSNRSFSEGRRDSSDRHSDLERRQTAIEPSLSNNSKNVSEYLGHENSDPGTNCSATRTSRRRSSWDRLISSRTTQFRSEAPSPSPHRCGIVAQTPQREPRLFRNPVLRPQTSSLPRDKGTEEPRRSVDARESDEDADDESDGSSAPCPRLSNPDGTSRQNAASSADSLNREQNGLLAKLSSDIADKLEKTLTGLEAYSPRSEPDTTGKGVESVVDAVLERPDSFLLELGKLVNAFMESGSPRESQAHDHTKESRRSYADPERSLHLAEREIFLLRLSDKDKEQRLRASREEVHDLRRRQTSLEQSQAELHTKIANLSTENNALASTLDEYRTSSSRWRKEIDDGHAERDTLFKSLRALQSQAEEYKYTRQTMRDKLVKLQDSVVNATGQAASEKTKWKDKLEAVTLECITLAGKLHEARAIDERLQALVRDTQRHNAELDIRCARLEREIVQAGELGRAEVERNRILAEANLAAVRTQYESIHEELQSQLVRLQAHLDSSAHEANQLKLKIEASSKEASDERQRAELQAQISRSLEYALEDKQRSEGYLNNCLSIANEKIKLLRARILHLEREVTTTDRVLDGTLAASAPTTPTISPKAARSLDNFRKISPRALPESIAVLQEQLQEREDKIELLDQQFSQVDMEAPQKIKARDVKIRWLRELLELYTDDLGNLVNTLSQPTVDLNVIRNAAIRIRTSLQMQQEEKELSLSGTSTSASPAVISKPVAPQATQLSAAIGRWRKSKGPSLRSPPSVSPAAQTETPIRRPLSPQKFLSGLLTPPSSYFRRRTDDVNSAMYMTTEPVKQLKPEVEDLLDRRSSVSQIERQPVGWRTSPSLPSSDAHSQVAGCESAGNQNANDNSRFSNADSGVRTGPS